MLDKNEIKEHLKEEYSKKRNFENLLSKIRKDEKMEKRKILQVAASFAITIGITAGIVCAATVVHNKINEKVFVEPVKISNYIDELKVTDEEMSQIITKEEAIQIAKDDCVKYGLILKDENIVDTEILKNPNADEISYVIKFDKNNTRIWIDAITGEITGFDLDSDYTTDELEKFTATRDEIIKVAENKKNEYGFGDEYKLAYISSNNGNDETKSYFWYIWFAKEYDGLFYGGESISMTIIPRINLVSALNINNKPFDNNSIEISEEQAKEIAKEKDKIVNTENYIIKEVKSELAIKGMNAEVYLKENGLENGMKSIKLDDGTELFYYEYKNNGKARKVYVIEIVYEERPIVSSRKYYVDVTTGEIIGGEDIFDKIAS